MGDEMLSLEDLLRARDAMYSSHGRERTRLVHPEDKQHLIEHDGYRKDCTRCAWIWMQTEVFR